MLSLVCKNPFELSYEPVQAPAYIDNHTIIRVKRIGICGTDLHAYEGTQPYFTYPRILGHELSGEIVETGSKDFTNGERVCILPYFNCGKCLACNSGKPNCCTQLKVFGVHIDGGMKEYISVPDSSLIKARNLSFDELALVEPLSVAAHGVRRADIKPHEWVMIIGAGPIGAGIIEFARLASENIVVMDLNEDRLSFCRQTQQIKHTVNPRKEDAFEKIRALTNGNMPEVIIDASGSLAAINQSFQYLAHGGRIVLVGLQKADIIVNHPEFHKREATLMSSRNATREDFEKVIDNIVSGRINPTTFISHRVGFSEIQDKFSSWLKPENKVLKVMVEC